jgi:hypothetical protein
MNSANNSAYTKDTSPIQDAISRQAVDQKLGCIEAISIAAELNILPQTVGRTLDQMNYRITHCQLGLFGHSPQKKIVIAEKNVPSELKASIEAAAKDGPLPCLAAWNIADDKQIPKTAVSNACEGLGIKISPCQLGAF